MLDRLVGLETEHAIRFTSADGEPRPGNDVIYAALAGSIGRIVGALPGERHGVEDGRIFIESGATFSYENFPTSPSGGLVESGTPECRGPSQLLCHQKALESILIEALPGCRHALTTQGFRGELGLIKNCRDAEGHVYGAQENYEAEVGRGAALALYRAALVLVLPVVLVHTLLNWVLGVLVIAVALGMALAALLLLLFGKRGRDLASRIFSDGDDGMLRLLVRLVRPIDLVVLAPLGALLQLPLRLAFRRQRRAMLAFLVSRPVITGAGTLADDDSFGLSEKGPSIERVARLTGRPQERALFDAGNLCKDLIGLSWLRVRPLLSLFRARQRMQLGLSDSNVAQVAEYLKIGTTTLVLDMAEAGALDDSPRLADPIGALHAIAADPTLRGEVRLAGGEARTALALQRWYLDRARRFVREAPVISLEARAVVRAWEEALDALERDPGRLVGELDWVTKRWLIEACGAGASHAVRKKIDLRYHELGDGYLARLERAGIARRVVSEQEVTAARTTPPESTPARLRGALIRDLGQSEAKVTVSWDSVRVGGRLRGKVIRLRE